MTHETGSREPAADREQLLADVRPVAFGIAYRMLGSVSEAEDVVQEALIRVHGALESGEQISSPRAFTATVTTRLAMDELRSARVRRERYVGDWLPEPLLTGGQGAAQDPARQAETADSLSMALLVLLETLSPEQRAVLLLHDVFGYGYGEVATIVGKGEANVRQLAVRARRHVQDRRPRFTTSPERQSELASRFFTAARTGDLAGLESLLAHDVELVGDGGGKAPSLARAQRGRSRVAHTLTNWLRALRRLPEMEIRPTEVNGDPGATFLVEGRLLAVWALDIRDGEVAGVRAIVNPDKLVHLGPVGDANALIRRLGGGGARAAD
ncbi:RNA polymerase sigma-70 factor [Terrabacter aerolatus]|uniref:DNA-directed RNA polymerase sigma-70 factor n=1 Tax=Terrabacter aerolatus TaxID=422442 RepID=A0A512CYE3_9MICO|nr:RNA polymerase sigma factor SigJ [Terrabacter aerolatus]GEO29253.1 DNA-directed RNA polymerase sigma-70 factor [Terrabacter aerolatus]